MTTNPPAGGRGKTLYVHGGLVITPDGKHRADVLVDGERIAALIEPGSTVLGSDLKNTVDHVVDATGKYLIPGGIDAHTHMQMPFGGAEASDTFATGTAAAAWGGTTTIVDFAIQKPGERVLDTLEAWHAKAAGQCAIDYGFHQIVGGVDADALKSLESLVAEGVTSVKLFMAYPGVFYSDDAQILKTMQRNAELGVLTMMHAENGIAIDELVRQALAKGRTDPIYHGLTRPWQFEEEATHRAIRLADVAGAPLYVVHVSARQAMARIAEARSAGQNVFGETCPHYLWLSLEEQLGAPGFDGAKWVCSTPLRPRAQGHQDGLWQHLRAGEVTAVATDHCPFCLNQKELGLGDFSKIPNGIGSVEHRIDLIYQGVAAGKITPEQWVRVCSTEPARMFGLYPRKGVIAPGSDADLVVYDPNGRTSIGVGKSHHMNMDYSAYEGWEIEGKVDTVISRGSVVVADGKFHGRAGHGKYLKRGLAQNLI